MKRPGLRPTLDGMGLNASSSSSPGASQAYSSGPPQLAALGGNISTRSSATVTGPGGRVLPRLSESWTHETAGRRGAPTVGLAPLNSTNQSTLSFLVSASGGMLTLGDHYHVSSSGVAEFKDDTRASDLGVAGRGDSELACKHISELDFENGFQIGRGSSGKVYNVLHVPSGKRVCVKQMTIDDAHHRDEIKRELDTLHKAPSRWVVDFHGAFFHNDLGVILLVLELMDGSLRDLLHIKQRLTEKEAKAVCVQAVNALAQLHGDLSLIHRDVKPENLLFSHTGRIKITDFGVSRGHRTHDPASVHTFVGSISYMSPERLEGRAYDYEVDVWSLGIVLCEMVTGHHPFQDTFQGTANEKLTFWELLQKVVGSRGEGSPLRACIARMVAAGVADVPEVSDDLVDFVDECLAYERTDRSSAERLLLHPWLEGMTVEESEAVVQEVTLDAARRKDAETRKLAQMAAAGSPQTSSSAAASSPSGMHTASGSSPVPTPEGRQRGEALMDALVASSRPMRRPGATPSSSS